MVRSRVRGAFGSSFSPEKTQAECACNGAPVGLPLPEGPVTSPAKAALALAPTNAIAHTAVAIVAFRRIVSPLLRGFRGSNVELVSRVVCLAQHSSPVPSDTSTAHPLENSCRPAGGSGLIDAFEVAIDRPHRLAEREGHVPHRDN